MGWDSVLRSSHPAVLLGCAAAEAGGTRQSWKVVCSLPQRRKEVVAGSDRSDSSVLSSSLQPFALRFRAAKAQVLRSSHFSTRGRSSQS
jgi:hypothetical protein